MPSSCIICSSAEAKPVFIEHNIPILRCSHCGHVYSSYTTPPDYDQYFDSNFINNEIDVGWWDDAHHQMYDDFCNRYIVGKSGKLLDVGCGLGYFVRKIVGYDGWDVYGHEISPHAVEFARTELKLSTIACGRVQDGSYQCGEFDIVTMWDVIEHLSEPDDLLKYINRILKPGGMLFMHTPNSEIQLPKAKLKKLVKGMQPEIHYLEAKDHVNIYAMDGMTTLLERNGFSKVVFRHLHPIQSVAGLRNGSALINVKNLWFQTAKVIFNITGGKINLDNLFVEAVK